MFKSNFLEACSKTPWWTVPFFWGPVCTYSYLKGVWIGHLTSIQLLLMFMVGILSWTFTEYVLHRFTFHWIPKFSWGKKMHFIIHGVHHDWPNDRLRLVMAPAAALVLAIVLGGAHYLLLGEVWFYPYFSGYLLGYIAYDLTHYAIHHLKSDNAIFKKLRRHHLMHHFNPKCKEKKYGVSSPLWDYVFGTMTIAAEDDIPITFEPKIN